MRKQIGEGGLRVASEAQSYSKETPLRTVASSEGPVDLWLPWGSSACGPLLLCSGVPAMRRGRGAEATPCSLQIFQSDLNFMSLEILNFEFFKGKVQVRVLQALLLKEAAV